MSSSDSSNTVTNTEKTTSTESPIGIRRARPGDWKKIREICCKTGNSGKPIDRNRWPFFGELWVGPYDKLRPSWTFVAERDGEVVGYITGCPDTAAFEFHKKLGFTPWLFLKALLGRFERNNDTKRFLRRTLGLDPTPESRFSEATHRELRENYRAHLHVNLEDTVRGGGVGAKLIDTLFAELRKTGVKGLHLFCGAGPVRFYEKTGFTTLEKIEFIPGVFIFCLVKKVG